MSFLQKDYTSEDLLILDSVRGYRQWYWKDNKLTSMRSTVWDKNTYTAECISFTDNENDFHPSPEKDCSCGIYAHYLPLESYTGYSNRVFGVIEASGKIIMGTKGFRAEKARLVALAGLGVPNEWFELVLPAGEEEVQPLVDFCTSIGVPYFSSVEKMLHEFPQVDLESLGVPDLSQWKTDVASDKERLRIFRSDFKNKQGKSNMDLDYAKAYVLRAYGISGPRSDSILKHLGGFS